MCHSARALAYRNEHNVKSVLKIVISVYFQQNKIICVRSLVRANSTIACMYKIVTFTRYKSFVCVIFARIFFSRQPFLLQKCCKLAIYKFTKPNLKHTSEHQGQTSGNVFLTAEKLFLWSPLSSRKFQTCRSQKRISPSYSTTSTVYATN